MYRESWREFRTKFRLEIGLDLQFAKPKSCNFSNHFLHKNITMSEMLSFNPGIVNFDPCLITIDVLCSLIFSYTIIYGTPRPSPKICEEYGKFTLQIFLPVDLSNNSFCV